MLSYTAPYGADTVESVQPILETALDAVLNPDGVIEASDGTTGLAAAALVVAWDHPDLLGGDAAYAPEPWPRTSGTLPFQLQIKAAAVMNRLSSEESNELAELWAEQGELAGFQSEIARWRAKL
ncbi:DUF4259 domain-containing protein [Arthrobacter sp. efr-133-TYG-104]|uniref:DUF4259 domain-containing protein n=1 Tax=Arthrobacter sp. efr-133-TYG-104 TaxID=3040324 RepID=UPI00254FEBE0|nr:DUF4259 domain-containing protein [Arthrobacter sp. efr-133-TYG-104]